MKVMTANLLAMPPIGHPIVLTTFPAAVHTAVVTLYKNKWRITSMKANWMGKIMLLLLRLYRIAD